MDERQRQKNLTLLFMLLGLAVLLYTLTIVKIAQH
jgi:predicted nucleic acid-binding Zn ribbon protein